VSKSVPYVILFPSFSISALICNVWFCILFCFFYVLLCNVNVTVTTTLLLLILLCVSIIYMNNIPSEQELPNCNLLTPNSKAFDSN